MRVTSAQKLKRQVRTRSKMQGSTSRPRFSVFRSNKHIYAQLIDDASGKTLFGMSDAVVKTDAKAVKIEKAKKLGMAIAEKAKEQKIMAVIFDKGGYVYHGRVKAVAEGAREGGLQF